MATTKDAKLLKQTKFPLEFNQKVDMKKVNIEVMKKWIAGKISEILGNEDDVVIELCFNLLEESRFPDIKDLQIKLTGFLDKETPIFCKELWSLCLSAQTNPQGVPKELLEAKKMELMQEKIESEKAAEVARRQKETNLARERNLDSIRQRERNERGRGGREPPGRRSYDRRDEPARDKSRSPSPRRAGYRRFSRSPPRRRISPPRDNYRDNHRRIGDLYIPSGRPNRYDDRRRRRSPSSDRSPPPQKRRRNTSSSERLSRRAPTNGRARKSVDSSDRSRSRSAPPRQRRRRSPLHSVSRSRSPRRDRKRRSDSNHSPPTRSVSRSRSRSRSPAGRDKEAPRSRPMERSRRTPSHSRSRSRTPTKEERRKRHRSLERYAPAGSNRRRRDSVASGGKGKDNGEKMIVDDDKDDE